MTAVSWPHLPQTHCPGVQAMICSVLGRSAGSSCRPGCLRAVLSGNFNCARSLSACTAVPEENLYSIPAPIAEQNHVAAQRFKPKPVPNQSMQTLEATLEAFTQIGRSYCQVDPGRGSKPKHKPMLFPKRRSVVLMSPNRNPAALRYSARHRALLPSIQRMLAGLRALRIRECCSQSARSSAAP
jgi:hypothetical protein